MLAFLLLAQTGIVKSLVAWVLVILCVLLGALPVIQPWGRKAPPKPE